jgi:type IV secretory pathway VirB4 component
VHEAEDVQNIVHMIIDPDGKVVLATQSLSEIASSPYRDVILESCPTKLYLPNAEARNPQTRELYQKFGLTERQIDIIAEAAPKRDYYYVSPLGRRLFQFALGPAALAFVGAGSKDDVLTARRRAVWANGRTTSPHISRRARRGRRP